MFTHTSEDQEVSLGCVFQDMPPPPHFVQLESLRQFSSWGHEQSQTVAHPASSLGTYCVQIMWLSLLWELIK